MATSFATELVSSAAVYYDPRPIWMGILVPLARDALGLSSTSLLMTHELPAAMRHRQRSLSCALALSFLLATAGCNAPWQHNAVARNTVNPFVEPAEGSSTQAAVRPDDQRPKSEEEALADVFDDLQQIGEADPLAREKLTAELRSVKPELWPAMVTQYKSALAYRRHLSQRETEPIGSVYAKDEQPSATTAVKATPASYINQSPPAETPPAPVSPVETQQESEEPTDSVTVSDVQPTVAVTPAEHLVQTAKPLPHEPDQAEPPMAKAIVRDSAVKPAAYTAASPVVTPWQEDLQAVITKLESTASASPVSTDEVHDHMQLRLLYLLAGQQGDAMLPLPGASPALQDYWSKQLFAMSTYLDNQQQPDNKRRAASSLIHLDQARAKLAEVATLQIRNLTFVDSVEGYGIYQRRESREFRAGDPVNLYAEVENFRSESTKEGYRTALSTSYEVVDANGQRVEGRQFPDVEDLCQNQRRDFHMQYGVTLPTRIYPGEYELRLVITDQLSHKIGQASVPFVIVE